MKILIQKLPKTTYDIETELIYRIARSLGQFAREYSWFAGRHSCRRWCLNYADAILDTEFWNVVDDLRRPGEETKTTLAMRQQAFQRLRGYRQADWYEVVEEELSCW